MKRVWSAVLILCLASSVFAQGTDGERHYRSDGFYIMLGAAYGPHFSDFFNYIDSRYQIQPNQQLKEFDKNFAFQLGYISRFHKNFGVDIGISVYGLRSKGTFTNHNNLYEPGRLTHDLQYQVGLFTVTFPVIFEFTPKQKIIPYVGIGLSIFAARLDDYLDVLPDTGASSSFANRDSRTSVGGHFEAGVGYKITRTIWLDLRGRWHSGSGHLAAIEPNSTGDLTDFAINQSVAQYMLGVDYYFR